MNFYEQLESYYNGKAKVIQVITYENIKLQGEIQRLAKENDAELIFWNRVDGTFKKTNEGKEIIEEEQGLQETLGEFISAEESGKKILYLEGINPELQGEANTVIKMLNLHSESFTNQSEKVILFSQEVYYLPQELEKNVVTLETGLPNLDDIKVIFEKVKENFDISDSKIDENDLDKLFNAVLGLSINEIYLAFNRAYLSNKRFTSNELSLLIKEKEKMIKKSGFLEYFHPKQSFKEIGGLENLKKWLEKRKEGFSNKAKEYGLTPPKGVLLLGIPGTGKSLAAKAVGSHWNMPLLKLDMGRIFGGIVGESEGNIRKALKLAETLSPSILWIDEIEKGLSGYSSSGSTDGGTTSRVLGTFLTWMQEKENPVFVIATANDISQLPPELLRKGRFDEIFFVDLPNLKDRKEIFKIHIEKRNRNANNYNLDLLSEKSIGFSGAEIEEIINEAMYSSFYNEEDLREEEIIEAIENTYPISKTMGEIIDGLRKWANRRAILASKEKSDYEISIDKNKEGNVPKLKQEMVNPFFKN